MRRSKYGAKKTTIDGITYDSKLEAKHGQELALLQKAGRISKLEVHPKIVLVKGATARDSITYSPDFTYVEAGVRFYVDVKGVVTRAFSLKKKLWRKYGRGTLLVLTRAGRGWHVEEVAPTRMTTKLGKALRAGIGERAL